MGSGYRGHMAMTALFFWILTAFGGAYMWLRVARLDRPGAEARHTRVPDGVLFLHPAAALGGFAAWIAYLLNDEKGFAWLAFAALVVAASGGIVMLLKTLQRREPITVPRDDLGETPTVAKVEYAEHDLPRPVIAGHGLLATVTIVLVFLEALSG